MNNTATETEPQQPAISGSQAQASSAPLKITVETITPEKAEHILKNNVNNRPVNEAHVRRLAKDMAEGKWMLNGDEIRLTAGNVLLDGQHRLLACVRAGASFNTVVICGLNKAVFPTIDTGLRRTGAHTLALMGETNATRLAATLRYIHKYLNPKDAASRSKLTNGEVQELLKAHSFARDSLVFALDHETKLVPLAQVAGLHYLFSLKNAVAANDFIVKLSVGVGLDSDDPILILRERFVSNAASKAKLGEDYVAALIIKSWNSYRKGEKVKSLRFREKGKSPEAFPVIE